MQQAETLISTLAQEIATLSKFYDRLEAADFKIHHMQKGGKTAVADDNRDAEAWLDGLRLEADSRMSLIREFLATQEPVSARDVLICSVLANCQASIIADYIGRAPNDEGEARQVKQDARLMGMFLNATMRGLQRLAGVKLVDLGLTRYVMQSDLETWPETAAWAEALAAKIENGTVSTRDFHHVPVPVDEAEGS